MRIGFGWDIHRLIKGRPLILGGIKIDSPFGLSGHSDADVVLHAVADALLGASAMGDIGDHFPDTDPDCKDMESSVILRSAYILVRESGYLVENIDINIIAQTPRLGEAKKLICENIALVLEVEPEKINVKAKTGEGLGPVGNKKAIEVQAVAMISSSKPSA